MSGWQCPDLDNCDFDLCEHCVRWIMHCVKENMPLGIVTPDQPELFGTDMPEEDEDEYGAE